MRKFLMATTAAVSCITSGTAFAQTLPVANTSAQAPNTPALQDIVVTAQRRSENVQRAAIAISVVSGANLVSAGVTQAQGLESVVPALTIENVGPSSASFIRGVGNFSVAVTSDPAVAFNYDGVYIGRLTATSRLLSAPVAFLGVVSAFTNPPRTYGVRGSMKF